RLSELELQFPPSRTVGAQVLRRVRLYREKPPRCRRGLRDSGVDGDRPDLQPAWGRQAVPWPLRRLSQPLASLLRPGTSGGSASQGSVGRDKPASLKLQASSQKLRARVSLLSLRLAAWSYATL